MTERKRVYYITYMDPDTGFLRREEYDTHREQEDRKRMLRRMGVVRIHQGSYRT